ncbi:hypothetical protein L0E83_08590 [Marichromatium gracile]|uniref:hypothetical protein n=1 Tax=Marichromatium gracile TaxID=1048 RepID=UPI001F2B7F27|nr:hypothetical protein [Marichromatium gracile]MCF1183492.1 hypothetical protein [Marichromatium gracile]
MADLETALVTLATASITGGVALIDFHLTNRATAQRTHEARIYEAKKQERTELLSKAEELYELTDKWLLGFSHNFLSLVPVMHGQYEYNTYLDSIIECGESQKSRLIRVEVLIAIYFQNLRQPYQKVLSQREEFNRMIGAHKKAYKRGEMNGERYIEPFEKVALALDSEGEALKMAIAEAARKIVEESYEER